SVGGTAVGGTSVGGTSVGGTAVGGTSVGGTAVGGTGVSVATGAHRLSVWDVLKVCGMAAKLVVFSGVGPKLPNVRMMFDGVPSSAAVVKFKRNNRPLTSDDVASKAVRFRELPVPAAVGAAGKPSLAAVAPVKFRLAFHDTLNE